MSGAPHFEICVQSHFSAAHHLRGYPGNCERTHGHNWTVDVRVECEKVNELGICVDFWDVKAAVQNILEEFDHSDLSSSRHFTDKNPTSENIAQYLYGQLAEKLKAPGVRVARVRVSETPDCGAWYWED